ncbi:Integrase catalytic subunit [Neochlamydia sp. TUME1]|nr:Integrase catalytic subunit [Neochlamydia sp. TUME1]
MNGKGRATDNIFVERSRRPVKYEDVYLRDYQDKLEVYQGLIKYFEFFNKNLPHRFLKYKALAKEYGVIIYYEAIRDLLEELDKRQSTFVAQIPRNHALWPLDIPLNSSQNIRGQPRKCLRSYRVSNASKDTSRMHIVE